MPRHLLAAALALVLGLTVASSGETSEPGPARPAAALGCAAPSLPEGATGWPLGAARVADPCQDLPRELGLSWERTAPP